MRSGNIIHHYTTILLGLQTATELGMLQAVNNIDNHVEGENHDGNKKNEVGRTGDALVSKYDSLFHGGGRLRNVQVKLDIDPDLRPIAQKPHRIPFHMRNKVKEEIIGLLVAGLIEKVTEASDWVSPKKIVVR